MTAGEHRRSSRPGWTAGTCGGMAARRTARRSIRFHDGVLLLASTASSAIATVLVIKSKVKYKVSISIIFSPKGSSARASRLTRRLWTGQERAELCDLSVSFASSNGLWEAEDGGREAGASAPWGSVSAESPDGQMHACTESGGERGPSAGAHARPLRAGCAPAGRGLCAVVAPLAILHGAEGRFVSSVCQEGRHTCQIPFV